MTGKTTNENYYIWLIMFAVMSLIPWAAIPMDMAWGSAKAMGRIINLSAISAFLFIFALSKSLRYLRSTGERSLMLAGTLFLAYASLRTSQADVPWIISYTGLFSILGAAGAAMSAYALTRDGRDLTRPFILWTVVFTLPILALPFLIQITVESMNVKRLYLDVYGLGNIRAAGHFTAIGIALLAPFALLSRQMGLKGLLACTFVVLLWATLFWSGSRAGLAALVPGLIFTLLFSQQRIRSIASNLVLGACGAALSTLYFLPGKGFGLITRLSTSSTQISTASGTSEAISTVSSGRTDIWAWAIETILEKPLHGWGYGSMINIPDAPYYYHTHNIVLEYALAFGIPIALAVFGLLAWLTVKAMKNLMRDPTKPMLAMAGIITVLPIYSLLSGVLINPYQLIIYLSALAISVAPRKSTSPIPDADKIAPAAT
jgi:hypothetical protein